jgi:CMP-N,N'-diacetyllegionaminic acid synthase
MSSHERVLAVIPARSGSKRLPGKNMRLFAGKPLLYWTIESALESKNIDEVLVSSDSDEVLKLALECGQVTVHKRSKQASNDYAKTFDYLTEILIKYPKESSVLLLQPTSPLREISDIDCALALHLESLRPVVSVSPNLNTPYWSFSLNSEGLLSPLFPEALKLRSQELTQTYNLNGAIYIDRISNYLAQETFLGSKTIPYVMSSGSSIDIDSLEDFVQAEAEMLRRLNKTL